MSAAGLQKQEGNAMAQVVVTYKTPKDPAAFDKYYAETHIAAGEENAGPSEIPAQSGGRGNSRRAVGRSPDRDADLRQHGCGAGGLCQPGGPGRGGGCAEIRDRRRRYHVLRHPPGVISIPLATRKTLLAR